MGEIILNGRSYNNGTKYLEVTQAEYNALPSSKLTDGTLYCITDAPGPGEGFPPMIYSYEEREVGVWVDGKPLYQKTIDCGICPNQTYKDVNHNILNLKDVIDIKGILTTTGSTIIRTSFSKVHDQSVNYQLATEVFDTYIRLYSRNGDSSGWNCIITLYYTKTTDTPGSGIWTTDGVPTVHYSTNEKVVGTWTDGKPLYEKTIEFTATSTANTYTEYAHGIANVDIIMIDFSHSYLIYTETLYFQIIPYAGNVGDQEIRGFIGKTSFDYRVGENTKGKPVKLTVQYTKTTD